MALTIKEFSGDGDKITFTATENSLMVEIEGIHGYPYSTGNFTRYMPEALRNTKTWTYPYNKPLILHHNTKNGKVIGRIVSVECLDNSKRSNSPALKFLVNVSDEDAKKAVKDGRLDTVSIGITATDVRCSICGHQITDDEDDNCEHQRGNIYEINGNKEHCFWDIYEFTAKEISYVVVPSDIYAKTERFYTVKSNTQINEHLEEVNQLVNDTQKISELEAKIKALEESNTTLKNQVDEIQKEKVALENSAAENKLLNEGLETELADTKLKLKESLIQQLQLMRLIAGKDELDKDKISNRTEESIRDSILDMTEEIHDILVPKKDIAENLPEPNSVKNPAVQDDKNTSQINIKESDDGNIDLKAGLENIFTDIVGLRK